MTNRSKQKGTAAETAIVKYLQEHGYPHAHRNPPAGSKDVGDVGGVFIGVIPMQVVIEAKNCERTQLGPWLAEAKAEAHNAGTDVYVVWHKKRGTTDPGKWFVTMPGDVLLELLGMAPS